MNNIDYLDLDGKSLRTFLTVLEEMSVSREAERVGGYSICGHESLRGVHTLGRAENIALNMKMSAIKNSDVFSSF